MHVRLARDDGCALALGLALVLGVSCQQPETRQVGMEPEPVQLPPRYPNLCLDETRLTDVAITLRRTGCLGSCPQFKLSLRGDGTGTFHGGSFVAMRGDVQFQFDPEVVKGLLNWFDRADFFQFSHEDDWGITDISSELLTLTAGGRTRTFENRWVASVTENAPEDARFHQGMSDLARLIEGSVLAEQWIGTDARRSEIDYLALARQSVERLIQATDLPSNWAIEFATATDIGQAVIVEHEREILPRGTVYMLPRNIRALYDKKTGTSRWLSDE